ncbi:hypothetical protein BAY61_17930 [Prauserella marina]|uniref:Uncharacterized protein n=1 Tax=Prauserella marina TaxID=530584 RepID=A0A222VRN2_9PSEU|nr:hypothetical protein [Prauserella marina]ASR36568.1 hypothetical protein BAY61_17930 [Prauserella marina]PWV73972.1 hypothetical protein DES30_108145 [Prauserella marina]SDD60066.1 hypothetical protein SAMN05421630_110145 [Prauserella marina]
MSTSDTPVLTGLPEVAALLERHVEDIVGSTGEPHGTVGQDVLRTIVTAAAKLYAHHSEHSGAANPLTDEVSPTAAVDLACGLLRARDLNPFDLALWFSRDA